MAEFNLLKILPYFDRVEADKIDNHISSQKDLEALKALLRNNKEDRSKLRMELEEMRDDGKRYLENVSSLFEIPLAFYCSMPNSGRYISEITSMVDAVIDVFREEFTQWEKPEDVKFVLCTRLTDELNLLKRNYPYYQRQMRAPEPSENVVIDIIQRKIRDVILSAPEPQDYEVLLDKVAKEFAEMESENQ